MVTKVVLISANQHREPYAVYPLGTAYLKAYLDEYLTDSSIEVLDMNILSLNELQQYLRSEEPDYICVSIRNVDGANSLDPRGFLPQYRVIIDSIKEVSKSPIIIGGAGFSIFPELFIEELGADYGIAGEGEMALCRVIEALRREHSLDNIPNLYSSDKKYRGGGCDYIESPQSKYEESLTEYYWRESGMLNIQTKRGCPYNCIYCTYPQIDGRRVRCMDIDSVVETIAKAKRDFGANYWFFTDSVFNIQSDFNMKFTEALVKSEVNISWGAYFSPSNITDEQMALYKASGLTHIEFGSESFCDKTLRDYGKHFSFDDIVRSSELALKHNVFYSHFLILGGWGEGQKELMETIDNSRYLRHTVIFPYVGMRVYPNTKLQQLMVESGMLSVDDNLLTPKYYISEDFDLEVTKSLARESGKAWIFPDEPQDELMNVLKYKKNKKGPLWEFLRKP